LPIAERTDVTGAFRTTRGAELNRGGTADRRAAADRHQYEASALQRIRRSPEAWICVQFFALASAIAELQALPAEAPERRLALPVLLQLRLTVPADPAQQTSDDQEFLMVTHDIVETWRREAIQEGVQQGLELGVERERNLLLRLLRRRFGAEVDGEIERRVATAPAEQVEVWAERVLSAPTLAELLAD
jgi:hypothetical protein